MPGTPSRLVAAALAAALTTTALAGCALSSSGQPDEDPKTVVVVTHDSWAMDKKVISDFEKKSGYTVKVRPTADAGELTNKLVLTKDHPLGDVVYGIDTRSPAGLCRPGFCWTTPHATAHPARRRTT